MLNRKDSQLRREIVKPAQSCDAKRPGGTSTQVRVGRARETEIQARFLNEFEVAEILGVSVATVRRWRLLGRGPKFLKVAGTLVRYPVEALNTWLASQPCGGEYTERPPSSGETVAAGGGQ